MKAIINGVRFDTDKAIEIGTGGSHGEVSTTDFNFWTATLYKTPRSGRYFLAGRGGARSMFSRSAGQNSWTGGEAIIPFESEEAAFTWAQEELQAHEIEEHFGHMIEDA
jgi:hypothetical protein